MSEGAVSQWLKRGREGGVEALGAHPPKGMAPRLTPEQKAQIPGVLARGAEAYGCRGDVWTARRVAEVIHRTDRACASTALMWVDAYGRRAGADTNQLSAPPNGMKPRSKRGMSSAGLPAKKSRAGSGHDRLES